MNEELNIIKKHYGENMMKLCRRLFPTFLEKKGLLSKLMLDNFAPSRFLYDDIVSSNNTENFKNYLYSLIDMTKKEAFNVKQSPKKLLNDAGYVLYECKCEEDIQRFRKYYIKDEELCTFNGGRLKTCHVFFAIKKNVDEIKRENYKHPRREDDYGVSVISIQFTRGQTNTLSIKNRYNHTVSNPDATFANDLENIIPGLTSSFEREYDLNINSNKHSILELQNYVKASDGRLYKYNFEYDNIYYCPNNIVIDNFEVKQFDKERYLLIDSYVLDCSNKTIKRYDDYRDVSSDEMFDIEQLKDCFVDGINDIQRIEVKVNKETGTKLIEIHTKLSTITIEVNNTNQIIKYYNSEIENIDSCFMYSNRAMVEISLPNVNSVGGAFLYHNQALKILKMPSLKTVGHGFLFRNESLEEIELINLTEVKNEFLLMNIIIKSANFPNLVSVGAEFLYSNECLTSVSFPNLERAGNSFMTQNKILEELDIPKLISVGSSFLYNNEYLKSLIAPKLQKVGNYFLGYNKKLKEFYAPQLRNMSWDCMGNNSAISKLYAPQINPEKRKMLQSKVVSFQLYKIPIMKITMIKKQIISGIKRIVDKLYSKDKNVNINKRK